MLCVLSPAKSLDYESKLATKKHSEPRLLNETKGLIDILRPLSPADIQKMMGVSADLAELNVERYAQFDTPLTPRNARPAVLAFAGDVYRGMDASSFTQRDFTHAQKTVRILSGLYGLLRPLDLMAPYRLEMGTKVKTDRGANLYSYWGDQITDLLAEDLEESPGADALVNLASNEYFSSVNPDRLGAKVISPTFLDAKQGTADYRIVSFFAKHARGSMAGWMVRNRVKSVRGLQAFDGMGYRYDPQRSSSTVPVFTRISPPPAGS